MTLHSVYVWRANDIGSSAAIAYLLLILTVVDLRLVLQLRGARSIAEGTRMSSTTYKFEKANRSLMERLFEPPAVGKMSPAAKVVAQFLLVVWSIFVLFPIYWVIITSFKDAATVNQGPFYIPFVDFQPTLDAWRAQFNTDPYCDVQSVGAADLAAGLQLLRFHRLAGGLAPADGAADLQGVPGLHQLHRDQPRLDGTLRHRRLHGGLCAGPYPIQAEVRQHPRCSWC